MNKIRNTMNMTRTELEALARDGKEEREEQERFSIQMDQVSVTNNMKISNASSLLKKRAA